MDDFVRSNKHEDTHNPLHNKSPWELLICLVKGSS